MERNAAEAAWLRQVGAWFPGAVPRSCWARTRRWACSRWPILPEADHPVWKKELMRGRIDTGVRRRGRSPPGAIHQRSAGDAGIAACFANDATFEAIRLEPYLRATASQAPGAGGAPERDRRRHAGHPQGAGARRRQPEEHPGRPARAGVPGCRMRLVRRPGLRPGLLSEPPAAEGRLGAAMARRAIWPASMRWPRPTSTASTWEPRADFEARAARLLPALALARLDGKSPVEYLDDEATRGGAARAGQRADRAAAGVTGCGSPRMEAASMSATDIVSVHARRIWDSRGRPTVEAEVRLADGSVGRGIAPAGASRGSREAVDLRDGGAAFGGFDVQQARAGVADEIAPALLGMDARDQAALDAAHGRARRHARPGRGWAATHSLRCRWLPCTRPPRARGVPLWRYLAQDRPVRLPLPEIQIFGGGAHAGRRIDIQDLMVMAPAAASFAEALEMTAEVYLRGRPPDARARPRAGRGRRGRLLAGLRQQRGGARHAGARDRGRRLHAGTRGGHLAGHRRLGVRRERPLPARRWTSANSTATACAN